MTVLAVAEHRRGELRDVSFEVLAAATELGTAFGVDTHAVVVGGSASTFAEELNRDGIATVHAIDGDASPVDESTAHVVAALADEVDPTAILVAHSVTGHGVAPAVATELGVPIVTGAIDLAVEDSIVATREMYGSKVETTVTVPPPAVVTIRPGEWPWAEGVGDATVETPAIAFDESAARSTITGYEDASDGDVDITQADVLVSVGRGIGEEANLELITELADAIGATVAASRPVVDNGWLPRNRQVGQSGKTVTPDVYIAIGISGAVQHVAGMKNAGTIVVINDDPDAPIFDIADVGVVGDLFDVVPALTEAMRG